MYSKSDLLLLGGTSDESIFFGESVSEVSCMTDVRDGDGGSRFILGDGDVDD